MVIGTLLLWELDLGLVQIARPKYIILRMEIETLWIIYNHLTEFSEHFICQKPHKDQGAIEIRDANFCPIIGLGERNISRDEGNAVIGLKDTWAVTQGALLKHWCCLCWAWSPGPICNTSAFRALSMSFRFYCGWYFQHVARLTLVWMAVFSSSGDMQIDSTFFALTGLC